MKLLFLPLLLIFPVLVTAQDAEYPDAIPTDQKDVVISPYDSTRRLDVAGLAPGSLAEDPVANKIFRIPFSNPSGRYQENSPPKELPPPPLTNDTNESIPPPPINNSPSDNPATGSQVPTDLLNFIYAFNQNSTVNDPDALVPFYADRVERYFDDRNVNKTMIRKDRENYINRFPQRKYVLDGAPVLLSQKGNVYEVMTRVRYVVSGKGKVLAGAVSDFFKIRRGSRRFEIISINEAKASAAPPEIQQQDEPEPPVMSVTGESVYRRFETEQLGLFLDAVAAAGEANDPQALLDFMHPLATNYYERRNPTQSYILKERRDYIEKWPERRYWLTEKPNIRRVSQGAWDVVAKTGYEVKNGSKKSTGVAVTTMRITHTSEGLKIASIEER